MAGNGEGGGGGAAGDDGTAAGAGAGGGGGGGKDDGGAAAGGVEVPPPASAAPRGRLVDVAAIVCSCCNWGASQATLCGEPPDVAYDDAAVASARRTVRVWRPRPVWVRAA